VKRRSLHPFAVPWTVPHGAATVRGHGPTEAQDGRPDRHPSARRAVPGADLRWDRPATGKQLILTGAAATEADAALLRDGFRKQVEDHTAVRTNVTLRVLLAEWLAGHQVEPATRASYALLIDKFILPALGNQTLPALAKLGPRPYERL
jgi:hypothetical protein